MCFAPQRRALFRNLNAQKWSEHVVSLTFWLGNVLRATTACNFSSLISPDGSASPLWRAYFSSLLFSSRLLSSLLFSSRLLSSLLFSSRLLSSLLFSSRLLSSLLFSSRLLSSLLFSSRLLSSLLFSSLLVSSLLFSFLLFSDSSHLCFSSVHIVGSLTSKLPSVIISANYHNLIL